MAGCGLGRENGGVKYEEDTTTVSDLEQQYDRNSSMKN